MRFFQPGTPRRTALEALCRDPQNNLRVFRRGAVVFDGATLARQDDAGSGEVALDAALSSTFLGAAAAQGAHTTVPQPTVVPVFVTLVAFLLDRIQPLLDRLHALQGIGPHVYAAHDAFQCAQRQQRWTSHVCSS